MVAVSAGAVWLRTCRMRFSTIPFVSSVSCRRSSHIDGYASELQRLLSPLSHCSHVDLLLFVISTHMMIRGAGRAGQTLLCIAGSTPQATGQWVWRQGNLEGNSHSLARSRPSSHTNVRNVVLVTIMPAACPGFWTAPSATLPRTCSDYSASPRLPPLACS